MVTGRRRVNDELYDVVYGSVAVFGLKNNQPSNSIMCRRSIRNIGTLIVLIVIFLNYDS